MAQRDVKVIKFCDNGNVVVDNDGEAVELEVWFRPIASVIDEAKLVLKPVPFERVK